MKTKITLSLALLIAVYLLSACVISITTSVNEDGSGEFGLIYKFTQDDLNQMAAMGMNADTICADMQSQEGSMPENYTFTQENHGDETWCITSESFDDLEFVKAGLSAAGLTINTLEIGAGKLTFDANIDLSGQNTSGMESMPIPFIINYVLTVPGAITNHNADSLNGNTASWDLSLSAATNIHLESNLTMPEEVIPTVVDNNPSSGNDAGNAPDTSGGNTGGNTPDTSSGNTGGNENDKSSSVTNGNTQSSDSGTQDENGKSIQDSLQDYWWAIAIALLCCCLIVIVLVVVVVIISRKRNQR